MDKVSLHNQICEKMNEIYERKNHDYGDSFAKLREKIPTAILVRLFDKYLRLETLLNQESKPMVSESIEDTLMDLANYCIMELIERKVDSENDTIRPGDSKTRFYSSKTNAFPHWRILGKLWSCTSGKPHKANRISQ